MTRKVNLNVTEGALLNVHSLFTHGFVPPHYFSSLNGRVEDFMTVYSYETHLIGSFSVE